jgi:uncharacterized protein (DUF362 family)
MNDRLDRRTFLKRIGTAGAAGIALGLAGCGRSSPAASPAPTDQSVPTVPPTSTLAPAVTVPPAPTVATASAAPATSAPSGAYLAVARGPSVDAAELTRRAIAAVGGIERFVKSGADVIVKPNICNAYHGPEYASTTNPEVVAAIVALCVAAGAKRVRVMDAPFGGTPQTAYKMSGIAEAVGAAGGEMEIMSNVKFRDVAIPAGVAIQEWPVYGDLLDSDVVINVPIAKQHGSSVLTLGMKNLMGVIQNRNGFHARGLHQTIADINSAVRPQLTVVDAIRILTANGPTGGNLDDVKRLDTIIASVDVVAADTYAATLFDLTPADVPYLQLSAEMGLGQSDLKAITIEEIGA